jgi:hypothetical protein
LTFLFPPNNILKITAEFAATTKYPNRPPTLYSEDFPVLAQAGKWNEDDEDDED